MRMSRRAGLIKSKKLLTLAELMAGVEDPYQYLYASTSQGTVSLDISGMTAGTPYYLFLMAGGTLDIQKVKSTGDPISLRYEPDAIPLTRSGNTLTSASTYYGYCGWIFSFPSYSESEIDSALSGMSITRKAYRNSTSPGTISTTVNTAATYIGAFAGVSASEEYRAGMEFVQGNSLSNPLYTVVLYEGIDWLIDRCLYLENSTLSLITSKVGGIWEIS